MDSVGDLARQTASDSIVDPRHLIICIGQMGINNTAGGTIGEQLNKNQLLKFHDNIGKDYSLGKEYYCIIPVRG